MEANESEVMNSAMAAEIHDRIMKFPDLYDTQVCFIFSVFLFLNSRIFIFIL